jgi:predicted nucleic acid-binding protein
VAAATAPVVIDTNILFSALLGGESKFTSVLLRGEQPFWICESVLVELFKRKEKIVKHSKLSDDDLVRAYHVLVRHLNLFKEALIPADRWQEARELCQGIDETDTPHVAVTLTLDSALWTGGKRLLEGLRKKGFQRIFTP